MTEYISIREYARRKGCSDPAVLKAIKTGKIINGCVIDEKGNKKIIPDIADVEWLYHSDPSRAKMGDRLTIPAASQEPIKHESPAPKQVATQLPDPSQSPAPAPVPKPKPKPLRAAKSSKKQLPTAPAEYVPVIPDRVPLVPAKDETLAAARKAQEVFKAKIAEIDYKKKIGELVSKDDVYKSLFTFGQELRTQFQAIPDRVVDNMLAASSRNEAHIILYEAITKVLENLADIDSRKIT